MFFSEICAGYKKYGVIQNDMFGLRPVQKNGAIQKDLSQLKSNIVWLQFYECVLCKIDFTWNRYRVKSNLCAKHFLCNSFSI